MVQVTIWKWKDFDEDDLVQAMGATAALDYPEGYENYVFADGSGGMSLSPDGEDPIAMAIRGHVFAKWCTLEAHQAMPQAEALEVGPQVVELLRNLGD
jgi:hypothetical protein